MIEEIKIMVSNLALKKGDIIIVNTYDNHVTKALQVKLSDFFTEIGHKAIITNERMAIKDVNIASDERLKEVGLMRIPEETKIGS